MVIPASLTNYWSVRKPVEESWAALGFTGLFEGSHLGHKDQLYVWRSCEAQSSNFPYINQIKYNGQLMVCSVFYDNHFHSLFSYDVFLLVTSCNTYWQCVEAYLNVLKENWHSSPPSTNQQLQYPYCLLKQRSFGWLQSCFWKQLWVMRRTLQARNRTHPC